MRPPPPVGTSTAIKLAVLILVLSLSACLGPPPEGDSPPRAEVHVLPDDGRSAVLSLVRGALQTLDLQMYLLTDGEVADVLIDLHQRARRVRVILDPSPYGADAANQPAFDRLAAAGIEVVWGNARFAFTHAKLLVIDGSTAAILTANLTTAGITTNREFLAVTSDTVDVADARALFEADWRGTEAPPPRGRLLTAPFHARAALGDLIDGARQRLDLEFEELSDSALTGRLIAAVARGVAVTVVAPARDRSGLTNRALSQLAAAGASVRTLEAPVVHAKALVADDMHLYVGSMNLTVGSLDKNREVGLSLDGRGAAGRVAGVIRGDAARGAPW